MNTRKYAGFWIRCAAFLIDYAILSLIFIIPSIMMIGGDPAENTTMRFSIFTFALVPAVILYFTILPMTKWQGTIGKKLLGLKIINENGGRVSPGQAILRYIGYVISNAIFTVGFIMAAFTDRKRGLHDMIAKTYVVKSRTQEYAQPAAGQTSL
ncbi:RDD family protein [Bacillus mangrovi]|uniref:RDD family protein n=1 Tax=Metabacillus mangrovi TaxID=1491830 RepID=A0A7X2V4Q8_9BACI|nr:RDD family protein [Metabacillus mangrovi]MTH53655.1 RDD family protein [Metabacillus mangrovi]